MALVRNTSLEPTCFVDIDDISVFDQDNNNVQGFFPIAFVDGTIFNLLGGDTTNTYLNAGQVSYIVENVDLPLDQVRSYAAGSVNSSPIARAPDDRAISRTLPISYEAPGNGQYEVLVANQGLTDLQIGFSTAIVLDDNGFPLAETIASSDEIVPSGGEVSILFRFPDFMGSATSMRVIVDADVPE